MISYKITPNKEQIADAVSLFEFVGGNSADAVRIAINKTARLVRTSTKLPGGGASQRIREQANLKASYVNKQLELIPATKSNPTARIRANSRGVLITRFSTIPAISNGTFSGTPDTPARGIRIKVKPSGSPVVFKGAKGKNLPQMTGSPFYIMLKNSNTLGIARRLVGSRKVHVFHGPSVSQLFTNVKDDITPAANKQLETELLDAMRYLLTKQYPKE